VARTLASLGGYAYAVSDNALWINLYIQGSAIAEIGGRKVAIDVTTEYPWDGRILLRPKTDRKAKFELRLRVPGWCQGASVAVNGETISQPTKERGYFVLSREWRDADMVELNLPMPVQRIAANPNVKADAGQAAIQRGPLVYCLEACDQDKPLGSIFLPPGSELKAEKENGLLGGVVTVKGVAELSHELDWTHSLYQPYVAATRVPVTAIPYFAWDNRRPGEMRVWVPVAPPVPPSGGLETQGKVSMSFVGGNCQPSGVNDGLDVKNSGEQPAALCHWWPHRGRDEWVQYTWKRPVSVRGAKAFWFDDSGRGACRLPASWRIDYLDGDSWKPVSAGSEYPVRRDEWCEVSFAPVKTTALRLTVRLQRNWAAGVHEWKVEEVEDE
jgi:hypothetical protein